MRWCFVAVVTIVVACGGSSNSILSASAYREEAVAAITSINTQTFIDQLNAGQDEPAMLLNEAWKSDTIDALETWQDAHETVERLHPPDSAATAHERTLAATECMSDAAERAIPLVEDERIIAGLDSISALIDSCTSLLADATWELDALPDD